MQACGIKCDVRDWAQEVSRKQQYSFFRRQARLSGALNIAMLVNKR
jgi:hypothetical protein